MKLGRKLYYIQDDKVKSGRIILSGKDCQYDSSKYGMAGGTTYQFHLVRNGEVVFCCKRNGTDSYGTKKAAESALKEDLEKVLRVVNDEISNCEAIMRNAADDIKYTTKQKKKLESVINRLYKVQ